MTKELHGVGVGYKPRHHDGVVSGEHSVSWLEIHAENYMADGGPVIAELKTLRERFPISCHGVGLSIGSEGPLDTEHLQRLKKLLGWLDPVLFSEHLAWSTHHDRFLNDLLPVAYNKTTLATVCEHVDQVQDFLSRRMLLENPSTYVAFAETDMREIEFVKEVAARTGCGLLLDVNNVYISATNHGYSPEAYIDEFPLEKVGEIHLGGHEADEGEEGETVLIDTHSRPVTDPVWKLYERVIERAGALPTLIEWDNDIPEWNVLAAEAGHALQLQNRAIAA